MNDLQREELFTIRKALDDLVEKVVENPAEINNHLAIIRAWKPRRTWG